MTRVQKAMLELAQAIKSEIELTTDIDIDELSIDDVIDHYQIEDEVSGMLDDLFDGTHIKEV